MAVAAGEPLAATPAEQGQIRSLADEIAEDSCHGLRYTRLVSASGRVFEVPETVVQALEQIIHAFVKGEAVSIVPVNKELTTQDAAELLNISRQYLVRMLDRGDIPHHKVGTHRRIAFDDLMDYKRRRDRERDAGFDELAELSQELGLYE